MSRDDPKESYPTDVPWRKEMGYRYREDLTIADAAFDALGGTMEELFVAASDAVTNLMVEELESIEDRERRKIHLEEEEEDILLLQLLQELLFYKDAEGLLLRVPEVRIERRGNTFHLSAEAYGEKLQADRHKLQVDVKAVTLHKLRVEETPQGWEATVVLDI
jgi:SHS2 domain-containing protein